MRTFKYIALFFCLALVFSCTKPADDSPYDVVPPSVTDDAFLDFDPALNSLTSDENDHPTPVYINDDGDDESGPSGVDNPK